jgi:hypothetical protein
MIRSTSSYFGAAATAAYLGHDSPQRSPLRTLARADSAYPQLRPPDPPGNPHSARLLSATVFFRHGARTPVFTSIPGLMAMRWAVCSATAVAALPEVDVTHAAGGPRPELSKGVARQVACILPGGCYAGQVRRAKRACQRFKHVCIGPTAPSSCPLVCLPCARLLTLAAL